MSEDRSDTTESQESENPGSQDLFQEDGQQAEIHVPEGIGKQLLNYLKKMDKKLDTISEDISQLKKSSTNKNFTVDTCSFKKKLNIYLKDRFSMCPWLDTQTDVEFKNEIKRLLRVDGLGGNTHAIKILMQWALNRFTDFRNQLRRRIINEVKKGTDLEACSIEEFSRTLLGTYCSAGQDVCSQERVQFALVLRSFLHKKKLILSESDSLECYPDFWVAFKEYHLQVVQNEDSDRWERLRAIDLRRVQRHQQNECES